MYGWQAGSTHPTGMLSSCTCCGELEAEVQGSHLSGKLLKTFSSQGNHGKTGGFQSKTGKKFQIRELFFQNIFKPFDLRKMFLRLLNVRSCQAIFA